MSQPSGFLYGLSLTVDCPRTLDLDGLFAHQVRSRRLPRGEDVAILRTGAMMMQRAIVTYHAIDNAQSPISIAPAEFRRQIEAFVHAEIRIASLAELATATEPAVALTFDDGYHSVLTHALPVLREYDLPATVFLIVSALDEEGFEGRRCLSWVEAESLRSEGFSIGAHTMTHPDLSKISQETARREILDSKRRIEDRLGARVGEFCYPFGASTAPVRDLVAEHFDSACSTELNFLSPDSSREHLERLDSYYLRGRPVDRLFGGGMRRYVSARRSLRRGRRLVNRLLARG